jgi:hypothetical protein
MPAAPAPQDEVENFSSLSSRDDSYDDNYSDNPPTDLILRSPRSGRLEGWTRVQTQVLRPPGGQSDMSKTTTTAKIRPDGIVVEILDDGSERPFPKTPMRPMTEA